MIGILHDVKVEFVSQPNCQAEIEVRNQEIDASIEINQKGKDHRRLVKVHVTLV